MCGRDWSSDVCSSVLVEQPGRQVEQPGRQVDLPPRLLDLPPRLLDLPPRLLDPSPRLLVLPPRLLEMRSQHVTRRDKELSLIFAPSIKGWKLNVGQINGAIELCGIHIALTEGHPVYTTIKQLNEKIFLITSLVTF